MKTSFTTLGCPDWDLDLILDAAGRYGFDGVDFRGYRREMAIYALPEFTTGLAATVGQLKDAGVEASAFSSGARMFVPEPAERDEALEEVVAYKGLCEAFGSRYIRVFGGKLKGVDPDRAVGVAVETLERMAEAVAPVTVMVETHDDWIDSALLARVFRQVRAPNVGVLWDLHHPFRLNGESPRQTYANIGQYVVYTHIKDSRPLDGDGPSHEYTLPGEGDVPNDEMIALLAAGGYDGWLTLEWEKMWHPELPDAEVALEAYGPYLRQFV